MKDRREVFYKSRLRETAARYGTRDLLPVEVAVNLAHTYDLLQQELNRASSLHGLSKSTLNILLILQNGPETGMQLHDLGELLLVSRANITGLIDHLEAKGLVKRTVDPADRRVRHARITKKAEALLDEYVPIHHRYIETLLKDLSQEDKQTLVNLLGKTRQSFLRNLQEGGAETRVA